MVPDGWKVAKISDIAEIISGQSPPGSEVLEIQIGLPFIQGNAEFGERSPSPKKWCAAPPKRARAGDVLLSVRAPVGEANVCESDLGIGRGVAAIRAKEVDPDLLFYILRSSQKALQAKSQGSTFDAINRSDLGQMIVLVPPEKEQHAIVERLSAIDAAIEKTKAVIDQTKRLKQGLLQELLTRGIGHTKFKRTDIGEIPEGWNVKLLSDVAEVRTGLAKGKKQIVDPVEMPYLRVANVQDGYLDLSDIKLITVSGRDVSRYLLQVNDVLMTEGGDFDKLGRGAVWQGEIESCLHQNHVFAVRCKIDVLRPSYLSFASASPYGKRYFLSCAKQTTNLASINSSQLKAFPVLLPPIGEQDRLISLFSTVDGAIENSQVSLQKLARIKSRVSTELLSGNKRLGGELLD